MSRMSRHRIRQKVIPRLPHESKKEVVFVFSSKIFFSECLLSPFADLKLFIYFMALGI